MLFTSRHDDFESEKERNLYYKFFAGYFFNELVPGVDDRLVAFTEIVNSCTRRGLAASNQQIALSSETTHVSFDNHAYLFGALAPDRGEFADIIIHDRPNRVVIPIEAKVHSNWSYDKDILANERRLEAIERQMPATRFIPCLLVTRQRWEECQRHESHEHSNYRRFTETPHCRTRVLLWEDLLPLVTELPVKDHISSQLARPEKGFRYEFEDGWFKQCLSSSAMAAGA